MSLSAALMIRHFSGFLAGSVLMEPRCARCSPSWPLQSLHFRPCLYLRLLLRKGKVSVPAAAQLFEQMIRIFTVFLLASIWIEKKIPITVSLAVFGLVAGGRICFVCPDIFFFFMNFMIKIIQQIFPIMPRTNLFKVPQIFRDSWISSHECFLSSLAVPLMANRLILNLLQSAETIMIPERLTVYGLTRSQAVSTYGTLTGMAMPFVLFPRS